MRRSTLPSLDDLRAFEVVARLGSVRAAAGELSLTHGAVSRRVAKLSRDLDLTLLEPNGRGLRLTADGQKLARSASDSFALVSAALDEIRSASTARPLVLSCERSLAMRWLIPRLSTFQDQNPDVELHLSVGGGPLDFGRDRVSLAVRRLDFPIDPTWSVTYLMPEAMGPVMPPAMLERFEAGDYVALGSRTRPGAWRAWLETHPDQPRPRATRDFDHHFLMAEAAAGGLGVALCPHAIAADDILRRRLIAPRGFREDGTDYGLIHPIEANAAPALRAIKTWLIETAANAPA